MIKLIIAEDDELERTGLIKNINWDELGINIVGIAQDGKQAFDMASNLRPDILITDIRMPLMDGITLAKNMKELLPDIKILFITGFDDFQYTLAAIRFKVEDYILKPYNNDIAKVENTIRKIVNKCILEKKQKREDIIIKKTLNEYRPLIEDKFFRDIVTGVEKNKESINSKIDFLNLEISRNAFLVIIVQTDLLPSTKEKASEMESQLAKISLEELLKEQMDIYHYVKVLSWHNNEFVIIINDDDIILNNANEISKVLNRVRSIINIEQRTTLSIGVSNLAHDFKMIEKCYRNALEAVNHKFYLGLNQIILYSDIDISNNFDFPYIDEYIKKIIMYIKIGHNEEVIHNLNCMYAEISSCREISLEYIQSISMDILLQAVKVLMEMNINIIFPELLITLNKLRNQKTIPDIQRAVEEFAKKMVAIIAENSKRRTTNILLKVKDIIHKNYMHSITLRSLSEEIYLSPNYINYIFKKESGISINKYLLDCRMLKAMELLNDASYTISKVAESVGYTNIAHFSTMFKKYTNVTPSQYRNKNYIL